METSKIVKASRVSMVVLFLGLIRCIAEPFRLAHYSATPLSLADAAPFLVGALVAGVALFLMTLLSFWGKYRLVVVFAILGLAGMVLVKVMFGV